MAIEDHREKEKKEVVVLVSPICKPSLDAAILIKNWAKKFGFDFREISILEPEGQKYVLEFGVKKVPALIIDGKLISEGSIRLSGVEGIEN